MEDGGGGGEKFFLCQERRSIEDEGGGGEKFFLGPRRRSIEDGGGGGGQCFLGPVGVGEGGGGDDWQVLGGTKNMPKCDTSPLPTVSAPPLLLQALLHAGALAAPRARARLQPQPAGQTHLLPHPHPAATVSSSLTNNPPPHNTR